MLRNVAVSLAFLLLGCGSSNQQTAATAPPVSSAAAPTNAPPASVNALVVAPMQLQLGSDTIAVSADGVVSLDAKTVGRFEGSFFLDANGKKLVTVGDDGTVTVAGSDKPAKFNDKNELEIAGGHIAVGDDGSVTLVRHDGQVDPASNKAKFVGFKPEARRAAIVVLTLFLLHSQASTSASGVGPTK